jgi:hypothetical protein
MIFKTILRYQRVITLAVTPIVFLFLLDFTIYAQDDTGGNRNISNIKWSEKGDIITVTYDLNGSADVPYTINAVMKRDDNPEFSVTPVTVEGDYGKGVIPGISRSFRWYFRSDYPQGIQDGGYYFQVTGEPTSSKTWIYYAIGGTALTAGIIALITSGGQSNPTPVIELPSPPPRP